MSLRSGHLLPLSAGRVRRGACGKGGEREVVRQRTSFSLAILPSQRASDPARQIASTPAAYPRISSTSPALAHSTVLPSSWSSVDPVVAPLSRLVHACLGAALPPILVSLCHARVASSKSVGLRPFASLLHPTDPGNSVILPSHPERDLPGRCDRLRGYRALQPGAKLAGPADARRELQTWAPRCTSLVSPRAPRRLRCSSRRATGPAAAHGAGQAATRDHAVSPTPGASADTARTVHEEPGLRGARPGCVGQPPSRNRRGAITEPISQELHADPVLRPLP